MAFLISFLLVQGVMLVCCQETLPSIVSGSEGVTEIKGNDALLRCQVRDLGSYKQSWVRTSPVQTLTLGEDPWIAGGRYSIVDTSEWVLKIEDVRESDSGEYKCEVNSRNNPSLIVSLNVVVPANIDGVEPLEVAHLDNEDTRRRIFNESDSAILLCLTSGTPEPTVTWIRHDADLSTGTPSAETDTLYFEKISRDDAGMYECTASNGYGQMDSEEIEIVVQYKPSINSPENDLRLGAGSRALLRCIVHSNPPAVFTWFKGNETLTDFRTVGALSEYIINTVTPAKDFGEYKCVASNIIGSAMSIISLSGQPKAVVVTSNPDGMLRYEYNLVWEKPFQGGAPINQYTIQYRKQQDGNNQNVSETTEDWKEHIYIPTQGGATLETILHNLQQNSRYKGQMWAVNNYGEGDKSFFEFKTSDVDITTLKPNAVTSTKKGEPGQTTKKVNLTTKDHNSTSIGVSSKEVSSFVTMAMLFLFIYSFLYDN